MNLSIPFNDEIYRHTPRTMSPEDNEHPQTPPIDPLTIGELLSLSEVAKLSGFNQGFLKNMAQKGRLRAKKLGHYWYTTLASVEEYKKSRHRGKRTDLDKSSS
jgi:hypothetical protein